MWHYIIIIVRTYSNGNKIYSVDMMLAYINIYKPKSKYINTNDLLKTLKYKGWVILKKIFFIQHWM